MSVMDRDFLALIQTFEQAAGRLETLDETLLTFSDVIGKLHQHLDELLEMVYLEDIITLAEKSNQKLEQLNQNLDQVAQTYESLVEVKQLKNGATNKGDERTGTSAEDESYFYYVAPQTNQVMVVKKEIGAYHGPVSQLVSKKLVQANRQVFALNEPTGEVVVLKGPQRLMAYALEATDFTVLGYELYYLSHQTVGKLHLLTQERSPMMEGVRSMSIENERLVCQLMDGTHQVLPLQTL